MSTTAGHRRWDTSLPRRLSGGAALDRPPPAHCGHAVAGEGNRGRMTYHRACGWRRCRCSRATGRPGTTGAGARPELNALPQFITEIAESLHPLHSRSLAARGRAAARRQSRMARFDRRAAEDHRSADRSHGTRRERGGRLRRGDSVDAGLRGSPGKPRARAGAPERIGRAWDELMKRLGYTQYVAQGGDWGAFVVDQMGLQAPEGKYAFPAAFATEKAEQRH